MRRKKETSEQSQQATAWWELLVKRLFMSDAYKKSIRCLQLVQIRSLKPHNKGIVCGKIGSQAMVQLDSTESRIWAATGVTVTIHLIFGVNYNRPDCLLYNTKKQEREST
jgi:hypothetical protein